MITHHLHIIRINFLEIITPRKTTTAQTQVVFQLNAHTWLLIKLLICKKKKWMHTGGIIISLIITKPSLQSCYSIWIPPSTKAHLLRGLQLRSHADVVSCCCSGGLTVRRLVSGSSLARATWNPYAEDHPLHVLLLCLSRFFFLRREAVPNPVTAAATQVLEVHLLPDACRYIKKTFCGHVVRRRRGVRSEMLQPQLDTTTTAASAPRTEPRGSERARL